MTRPDETDPRLDETTRGAIQDVARAMHVRAIAGDATADELALIDWWLAQDPAHRRAYAEVRAIWDAAGSAKRGGFSVSRRLALGGGGGVLAAALVGGVVWTQRGPGAPVHTDKGERAALTVPDFAVELGARTRARLWSEGTATRLALLAGEAYARSEGRPGRILEVVLGAAVARLAEGAASFWAGNGLQRVACAAGVVEVRDRAGETARLTAGDRLDLADGRIAARETAPIDSIAAWRRNLLVFHDEPIAHVVADLNRYRDGQIVIVDAALAQSRMSGVFHLERPEEVLAHIAWVTGAQIVRLPGDVILLG